MQQTWQEFIGGNDSAISLVFETYHKNMLAYGIAIGFCEHFCNDAVQDVFCSICHSRKKMKRVEDVQSYLLHCMKNRLYDIYKAERRKLSIDYEEMANNYEDGFIDKLIAEENSQVMEKEVDRLLKKLRPKHREIIILRFSHNLSYEEIAAIVEMTPGAVKKQLYRSLKLMEPEAKSILTTYYNTY